MRGRGSTARHNPTLLRPHYPGPGQGQVISDNNYNDNDECDLQWDSSPECARHWCWDTHFHSGPAGSWETQLTCFLSAASPLCLWNVLNYFSSVPIIQAAITITTYESPRLSRLTLWRFKNNAALDLLSKCKWLETKNFRLWYISKSSYAL